MPPEAVLQQTIVALRTAAPRHREPFVIAIISNPCLSAPGGEVRVDPISRDEPAFQSAVQTIFEALFGQPADQAEPFLGTDDVAEGCTVQHIFLAGYPAERQYAFVQEAPDSDLIGARRWEVDEFLRDTLGIRADLVFVVTASETHNRDAATAATDDEARGGVAFTMDGVRGLHCYYTLIPGAVAFHASSNGMIALHEAGHALGSYQNGVISDLYVDDGSGINAKRGRPIPERFAVLNGTSYRTDPSRNGLGYPDTWQAYHCELHDPEYPSVMDNFWEAAGGAIHRCQHDRITRQFLLDRVRAKISRGGAI
jgi:hypothetical protein